MVFEIPSSWKTSHGMLMGVQAQISSWWFSWASQSSSCCKKIYSIRGCRLSWHLLSRSKISHCQASSSSCYDSWLVPHSTWHYQCIPSRWSDRRSLHVPSSRVSLWGGVLTFQCCLQAPQVNLWDETSFFITTQKVLFHSL